jgi:hypothetical protein
MVVFKCQRFCCVSGNDIYRHSTMGEQKLSHDPAIISVGSSSSMSAARRIEQILRLRWDQVCGNGLKAVRAIIRCWLRPLAAGCCW